jgi:dephospho-CoA kinase
MLRVGLTGGISTGKSNVGHMLAELGCHVTDSDAISHRLFEHGHPVHKAVIKAFGSRILSPDGSINRKILAEIVFGDPLERQKLNALVHPAIIEAQKAWLEEIQARDPQGIAIVEAALMIEVGTYRNYDKLIVVFCSPEEQLRRLQERSGLTSEQARARVQSQMPIEEKIKYADYLVNTTGTIEETWQQVELIHSSLRQIASNSSEIPRS